VTGSERHTVDGTSAIARDLPLSTRRAGGRRVDLSQRGAGLACCLLYGLLMVTTLALSDGGVVVSYCQLPLSKDPAAVRGVFFDVRSEGPAVRLTALTGAAEPGRNAGDPYGDKLVPVTVYAGRWEGSGAGREKEEASWRVVGAGVFQSRGKGTTRLAL
jgi:hypothetical protein